MRRMWPALLLWFCLSWVLLLHLWIKSVLQILEEFCLLGESQLLCHVPEVIYLGLLNCGFTFLLSILFETSFFLWVLFSGFYVLKITTAKSWLPWQLFCCPLPPPPPRPRFAYCQQKWKILNFRVDGSIYCLFSCPSQCFTGGAGWLASVNTCS